MASVFPGGLDNIAADKLDSTPQTGAHPAHHNDLANAVNAIEVTVLAQASVAIPESRVTNLVADLALKAPLAGPSFTGGVNVAGGMTIADNGLAVTGGLQVSTLGITVTGNSTITGTLGGITTLTATTLAGTLSTPAQGNITSVGILAGPHMTTPVVDSGGLVITVGGLRVSAGNIGVGAAAAVNTGLYISGTQGVLGTGAYGVWLESTGPSSATAEITGIYSKPATAAAAFTCSVVAGFRAGNPTKGSGSAITNAYGFWADSVTSGNTNNYGLYVSAPSGGSGVNVGVWINGGGLLITGTEPTSGAGIGLGNTYGNLGATAGGLGALPATVAGYWQINVAGTIRKIPFYAA